VPDETITLAQIERQLHQCWEEIEERKAQMAVLRERAINLDEVRGMSGQDAIKFLVMWGSTADDARRLIASVILKRRGRQ
jgi:hypothetical protein